MPDRTSTTADAEIERGRRLHHLLEPGFDRRDDRAGERHGAREADAALGEGRDLEGWLMPQAPGPSIADIRAM